MEREETSTLMTTDDLVRHLRMSRVTIWRKRAAGDFPKPCALGGGQLRWKRRDIDEWIDRLPVSDPVCPTPPRPPAQRPRDFGRLL